MAKRFKSFKDITSFYELEKLKANQYTPYPLGVSLRTGGKPAGGYLSKLHRNQKKVSRQLRGLPGCGPTLKEWMTGYD